MKDDDALDKALAEGCEWVERPRKDGRRGVERHLVPLKHPWHPKFDPGPGYEQTTCPCGICSQTNRIGDVWVDIDLCRTTYPGIHTAFCKTCGNWMSVYCGIKDDHKQFFANRIDAVKFDRGIV